MASLQGALGRAASSASGHAGTFGYLTGWRVVRMLPEPAARAVFDRIADQIHRRNPPSVQRLRSNLLHVRPELDAAGLEELTHAGVRSYLRYWCESFRLPTWDKDDLVSRTRVIGEEHVRGPQEAGRGVVVALPHMGNWDWAGAWATSTGMPLTTVAERLRPERLYDEFVAYRRSLGMEILPLTGGEAAYPRLTEVVAGGGLVCLLADRDISRTSIEVDLCGHRARMPRGPAMLARDTGTSLVPVTTAYRGRDIELTLHEPVPHVEGPDGLRVMMQKVADAFTEGISADPQDWHMMQRVFSDDTADLGRSG